MVTEVGLMIAPIVVTGTSLRVNDIRRLTTDPCVTVDIDPVSLDAVDAAKAFLDQELERQIIYGVNTGFGPMVRCLIARDAVCALQGNLIRSHAAGIGQPLPDAFVLSAMLVRLNTLARGFSGVSRELLDRLRTLI